MRRRETWGALLIVMAVGVFGGAGTVLAACQEVSLSPTGFDPAQVCTGDEDAQGTVAVTVGGEAQGPEDGSDNPGVAVSGTGDANHALLAVSGTGKAGGPHEPRDEESAASISGTGDASGFLLAVSGIGDSTADGAAVSGRGDSSSPIVSVSGTGYAGGHSHDPDYDGHPLVAISGCRAEHAEDHDPDEGQVLTADPSRVHVAAEPSELTDPDDDPDGTDPTDYETGQLGAAVQGVTCPIG